MVAMTTPPSAQVGIAHDYTFVIWVWVKMHHVCPDFHHASPNVYLQI